ncbi:MAG: nucleotidyltransferase domain-containing protein [Deltaproteobacteria bacterium]|jgi:predicted nucleotidyltransferase|nr:nucleotidyltransferase domain-containing protein [Deltaproteobacteria bacterium]
MAFTISADTDFYGVRTLDIVTEAVKNYAEDVRSAFPVVKVYMFGSWAKGTATKHSDVDVCFFLESLYENPPPWGP